MENQLEYKEGAEAWSEGIPREQNPYKDDADKFDAWNDGWTNTKRKRTKQMNYRGFSLSRGRSSQDWCVSFPAIRRTRYGTLAEVRADVDAFLAGTLTAKSGRF